jgi:hypothetical protein
MPVFACGTCAGVFDGQRVGFSCEGGEGGRHLGQARAGLLHRENVRPYQPWHCTPKYGTTRHETPCDRRHTGLLTKMLTKWLVKTSGSCQTRRSPPISCGVSEGTRTPDTQDHNYVRLRQLT